MATINIGFRLFAGNEEEASKNGMPFLEKLFKEIAQAIEPVEEDCAKKYPDLVVEYSEFDSRLVSFDQFDVVDGKEIWDLSYWMEVRTISPDGISELDYNIGAYDQWTKLGSPMYRDVCEPLGDCDWFSVESFLGATGETMGRLVWVQFDSMKAVDSYHGGVHFYNNHCWL